LRQKCLLDVACGFEIVLDTVEFPLGFGLAQGGFDMFANFTGYASRNDATDESRMTAYRLTSVCVTRAGVPGVGGIQPR
jgi:hypothetical protein